MGERDNIKEKQEDKVSKSIDRYTLPSQMRLHTCPKIHYILNNCKESLKTTWITESHSHAGPGWQEPNEDTLLNFLPPFPLNFALREAP